MLIGRFMSLFAGREPGYRPQTAQQGVSGPLQQTAPTYEVPVRPLPCTIACLYASAATAACYTLLLLLSLTTSDELPTCMYSCVCLFQAVDSMHAQPIHSELITKRSRNAVMVSMRC